MTVDVDLQLTDALRALDLDFPAAVRSRLLLLRDELLRWNRRVNLTAIIDPEEALEKHLVDSLTVWPEISNARRLLDLGSGGGFPGLPLALACPRLQVFSVDAVQKKIAFQRHAARLLQLNGFTAWHGRAEQVPQQPWAAGGFDRIVSRAFASLELFARLALPCLAPAGQIVAMKGPEGPAEWKVARVSLECLGLACRASRQVTLPGSGARRTILTFERS